MNLGKFNASSSINVSNNCCPALLPLGSVTFKVLFFPLRSTVSPLLKVICKLGGMVDPSLTGLLGLNLLPPSAQAIESRTDVFP